MSLLTELPHVWQPGDKDKGTVLALHGMGADEHDLLPLVNQVAPGYAILSPRGQSVEGGVVRWFRRLPDGSYDQDDMAKRLTQLKAFVQEASQKYGFSLEHSLTILGFSNGANMGAALLLRHPELFSGAALLRAGYPLAEEVSANLKAIHALVAVARQDEWISVKSAEKLIAVLKKNEAEVTEHWSPRGHQLEREDLHQLKQFFG
jgi:predicted esterase